MIDSSMAQTMIITLAPGVYGTGSGQCYGKLFNKREINDLSFEKQNVFFIAITCEPHSTLSTPSPARLSILIGTLQPSEPPRPSFP